MSAAVKVTARHRLPGTGSPAGDPCCEAPLNSGGLVEQGTEHLAHVFAALGDPARLRIYAIIASNEETCSCHLEGPLGKSQSTISHHTTRLAKAGLIVGERRGRWTWWRSVPSVAAELGLASVLFGESAS